MSEELDQELWDLIKEPVEEDKKNEIQKKEKSTPRQNEKKQNKPTQEKGAVVTERRKKALILYLVGLFGIAFVVVLVSLLMKGIPGNNPQVDNSQLEALQAQVQALEAEKEELKTQNEELVKERDDLNILVDDLKEAQEINDARISELNALLVDLTYSTEYLESGSVDANAQVELLLQRIGAYELLIRAQNNYIDYNKTLLESTMKSLEGQLEHLSQEALSAYYMIMEYMEQPYLGQ